MQIEYKCCTQRKNVFELDKYYLINLCHVMQIEVIPRKVNLRYYGISIHAQFTAYSLQLYRYSILSFYYIIIAIL